ncbi:MAG: helicase C-terminal domain-containing protein, partial [Leptolyngbyaceae bacterium]|nr:helicase C-terminal domain-containing protein [Leptolyngbyaceae bacterium]
PSGYYGRYRLSYLMPAVLWPDPVVLVVPEALRQRLLLVEIPRLQQWMSVPKPIQMGDRWPSADYQGLLLTSVESWLEDRLNLGDRFPDHIPTIIDGVENLEAQVREALTLDFHPQSWNQLMLACPQHAETIRNTRVQLTHSIFQHPQSPYDCYLIDADEHEMLLSLGHLLTSSAPDSKGSNGNGAAHSSFPTAEWSSFLAQTQRPGQLIWTTVNRDQGVFSLHCCPFDVTSALAPVWHRQPVVLIGGSLDLESDAPVFRQRLGLEDLTCLKFSPDPHRELIQVYVPDRIPMPNTPQFQPALIQHLREMIGAQSDTHGLTVILIGDVPLKAQVASQLASEYGSRVQVEKTCLDENGILVSGWEFWQMHQAVLPTPNLLAIATLPIPSLEHPLVAGRVSQYKRLHQNWFRLYLLPETLNTLQQAIAPMRESQGVVALLDNRVNHRSYGSQVLSAISPHARISYLDSTVFKA